MSDVRERYERSLNRVAKWRSILTGQVAGTRTSADPVGKGYRDIFEKLIILRAEVTALGVVLIDKGVMTTEEFMDAAATEADELSKMYEKRFPGMVATDEGVSLSMPEAAETMKGWPD